MVDSQDLSYVDASPVLLHPKTDSMYYVLYVRSGLTSFLGGPLETTQLCHELMELAEKFDNFTGETCEYFITQKLGG